MMQLPNKAQLELLGGYSANHPEIHIQTGLTLTL